MRPCDGPRACECGGVAPCVRCNQPTKARCGIQCCERIYELNWAALVRTFAIGLAIIFVIAAIVLIAVRVPMFVL
jgi:hypothetical protein